MAQEWSRTKNSDRKVDLPALEVERASRVALDTSESLNFENSDCKVAVLPVFPCDKVQFCRQFVLPEIKLARRYFLLREKVLENDGIYYYKL